jgi:glyoxylase-like metal-dependent hydrolase (beta-lactamase superfamily II)
MLSQLIKIKEGAYAVRHPIYLTNSYIVKSSKGVYLLDSGVYANGSDMLWALGKLKIGVSEVRELLLTHWHNDHTGGASVIRSQCNGLVYYHQDASSHFNGKFAIGIAQKIFDWMPDIGPLSLIKRIVGQCPPRPIGADKYVKEGDVIDGLFHVWETPGHETGHISYWFPEMGLLFTGDAIAVCGKRIWYMSRLLTKEFNLAKSSMIRCLDSGAEYICPGHQRALLMTDENTRVLRFHLDKNYKWPLY